MSGTVSRQSTAVTTQARRWFARGLAGAALAAILGITCPLPAAAQGGGCQRPLQELCDPCDSYEDTLAEQSALAAARPLQIIVATFECGAYKVVVTLHGDDGHTARYFGNQGLEGVVESSDVPRPCGATQSFRRVFGQVPDCTPTCRLQLHCDPDAAMARFCSKWHELPECGPVAQ